MSLYAGIILKNVSIEKRKIALFTQDVGLIYPFLFIKEERHLSPGMIVQYSAQPFKHSYSIDTINILFTPQAYSYRHLHFLHAVIELFYYGTPENYPMQELFKELYDILTFNWHLLETKEKRLIMLRILWHTGIFSEQAFKQYRAIIPFFTMPIEKLKEKSVECNIDDITHCLHQCLAVHPKKEFLKTFSVGYQNGKC